MSKDKFICIAVGREIASANSLEALKRNKEVKLYFEKIEKEFIEIYELVD